MLAPLAFILAFMLALAGALLENSARAVDAAHETQLAQASDIALSDGVADFTHDLAAYVAQRGTAGPWPQSAAVSAPRPLCAPAGGTCALSYVISGTITAASSAASAAGGDAAPNLQGAVIDEQRVSAVVTVAVHGPGGTSAQRTRLLTYRVFANAPYAVISGSRDVTAINATSAAAPGDSGGSDQTIDTRIHVRLTCRTRTPDVVPFENDQHAPGNDALPWGNAANAAYETPCSVPDAPVDAFHDERWRNGDTNGSGWTQ